MKRESQKDKAHFKEGERLINKYPDLRESVISRTIDEACVGSNDTAYHRKIAREALEKK